MNLRNLVVALSLLPFLIGSALGTTLPVVIQVGDGTNSVDFSPDGIIGANQLFSANGSINGGTWQFNWSLLGGASVPPQYGSGIKANWTLLNETDSPQNYDLSFTLSLPPTDRTTLSNGLLSATVGGETNATVSSNNLTQRPFLVDQIDHNDYKSLFEYPLSISNSTFVAQFPPDGTLGFGLPAPAVQGSITMNYSFNLTPGAELSVLGSFSVLPVPEPATLSVLGTGAALALAMSMYRRWAATRPK